jgi:hypothetical protein
MGAAIETVAASLTPAATATAQAMTPATGQSFNVRATASPSVAHLEALWAPSQAPGDLRIRSPRLHDDVNALRFASPLASSEPVAKDCFAQTLYSQDQLIVEEVYTAAPLVTDLAQAFMQVYYDDLPGIQGNYMTWAEVVAKVVSYFTLPVEPSSAAVFGDWGPGVAINSSVDVFKANSWYALLGYICPVEFGAMSILGTDLGNLMVGGPGSVRTDETRDWFKSMEDASGKASIPVINSQNKGATLVSVFDATTATAFEISLIFAYLGPTS